VLPQASVLERPAAVYPPSEPLRVAVIADMLEEGWASMDLVADSLVRELVANAPLGIDPALVRPRLVRMTRPWRRGGDVPTRDRVFNRFWLYRRALLSVRRADLFHIVDHSYAHLASHCPRGRAIVTCHDIDAFAEYLGVPGQTTGLPAFLVKRLVAGLQASKLVVCPSESTASALVKSGLIARTRLTVVPNGVDVAPIGPARSLELTRDLLGEGDGPYLLHVGSTIPRKRLDILLEAFAGVVRSVPTARLIRVGGRLTAYQADLTRLLGISEHVIELPRLDRETLKAVYSRAAVLLATSEREGFGLPVVEALAVGTPVIATDLPVFREVASDAAMYVPLERTDLWVRCILDAIAERSDRPESWRRRQFEARRRGMCFSWSSYAARMATLYREVLAVNGRYQ
jgi:glycosyltransferase involved in cell wall biosynthesis